MMKLSYLFLFLPFLFMSCEEELHEKVVGTYYNGAPIRIEFYKWVGDNEVLVKHLRYYETGEKQEEGYWKDNKKNGKWTYWYENGNVWSESSFNLGMRDGSSRVYYKSGKINYSGEYVNDKTEGEWIFYDGEGNKTKKVIYKDGKKTLDQSFED